MDTDTIASINDTAQLAVATLDRHNVNYTSLIVESDSFTITVEKLFKIVVTTRTVLDSNGSESLSYSVCGLPGTTNPDKVADTIVNILR